jgi:hypothetical protein
MSFEVSRFNRGIPVFLLFRLSGDIYSTDFIKALVFLGTFATGNPYLLEDVTIAQHLQAVLLRRQQGG